MTPSAVKEMTRTDLNGNNRQTILPTDKDKSALAENKMVKAPEKTWFEKYGSMVLTISIVVITAFATNATTFYVMQYRQEQLEIKHKDDIATLKEEIKANKAEARAASSDAQAYGNSALQRTQYLTGLLIGKNVLNTSELVPVQSQTK